MPRIMSEKEFRRFSEWIHGEYGVKMPLSKKTMLQSRLLKRLRKLGMTSFSEYYEYLFSPEGAQEVPRMIDLVTTHKTDFFREPAHFEYLVQTVLPKLIRTSETGVRRPFRIWSAGCSSGEEAYTLAMVLSEFAESCAGFHFSILATDISIDVLKKAQKAIYEMDIVDPIPLNLKKKYLLRSRDRNEGLVRVIPQLRTHVTFRPLNFMDREFGVREKMDVIFCRNVVIYFDRPTQEALLNRFCHCLHRGGYVFMGHSETLNGLNVPLKQTAPTVYRAMQ